LIVSFARVLPRRCRSLRPPGGFGSVACSMPLGVLFGLIFGRGGPPLSGNAGVQWFSTENTNVFSESRISVSNVRPSWMLLNLGLTLTGLGLTSTNAVRVTQLASSPCRSGPFRRPALKWRLVLSPGLRKRSMTWIVRA
jgi:hypothetical protein